MNISSEPATDCPVSALSYRSKPRLPVPRGSSGVCSHSKPDPLRQRRLRAALAAVMVMGLVACGSDDDDEPPAAAPPPAPAPTTTLTGVVLDGPLQNAKVCLDLNDNRLCDAAEPSTTTNATGAYTLAGVLVADAPRFALLAEAAAGTSIDVDTGPVTAPFTLVAPAGQGAVISPFTTLVQSEIDSGRAPNRAQAEETILGFMVGVAGDVGGLTLNSSTVADATDTPALAARRARMAGLGQLLTQAYARIRADRGLTGKALVSAYGLAATGSLQQVLSQVTGPLTAASRDGLFNAVQESLVPTAAALASVSTAAAKTAAAPIEGAWVRTRVAAGITSQELYLFAGDGTFVHQTITPGVPAATSTAFDNGYGYRYGRYAFSAGTLTTTLIEAAEAAGPSNGTLAGVAITGDTLTADGGVVLTRVAAAGNSLVGGWVRPEGTAKPEFLVMFADGTYVHSSFYYQNDPQTGTASFFETAKSAGLRKGTYGVDAADAKLVNFGATTVAFNGNLTVPSNPGVAVLQPDGSLSMTDLRLVRLGTADAAKAVTGFSEAVRSRLWSGRWFSRTLTVGGASRLQYVYVRGPADVLTFLQAPVGSAVTVACGSNPATQGTPVPDFTTVAPTDGKLKQFVVGTGTAATNGYAQRRLNVGLPGVGNFVTYTPITRPTDATARCAVPL